MSARDAESGSSTYKGGSGRAGGLGNGGVGGGMGGGGNYGGGMGGGAARNGGIGSRTGLTTGNRMYGGTAVGRPGGMAQNPGAWGVRPSPAITQAPLNRPAVPGLLGPVVPVDAPPPAIEDVPLPPTIQNPFYQPSLTNVSSFINAMKSRYGWGSAQPGPGPTTVSPPNALDNDISTLMDHSNRTPREIGGMAGGMGVPGYASRGTTGYGGTLNSPRGGGGGGW